MYERTNSDPYFLIDMKLKLNPEALLLLLLTVAFFLPWPVLAQQKIQVVTKTITRNLDLKKNTQLRISGEKAKIVLKGWNKPYIGLTLKLTGKHPERQVAEKDLEHLQFYIRQNGNVHDLGNYFLVEKGGAQIRANLKAEYEIWLPDYIPVTLVCKFGEVSLENTKSKFDLNLEYTALTLNKVEGEMTINSLFSDIKSQNTNLTLKCKAEKADLDFAAASGAYQFQNNYGQIRFSSAEGLLNLNIQASRTSITLFTKSFEDYNYDLVTTNANLALPTSVKLQPRSGAGGKTTFLHVSGKNKPAIKILTTYSPIIISNQVN
jgi:hypothetical protein